jgi:NAD(P) transhydrogenase
MTETVGHNIERHGIELIHGHASLGPNRTVVVRGQDGSHRTLHAKVILIATGSRPYHPPEMPFEDPDVYDSEEILEIDRPFRSLVVIGGGPVGCEYASIFTALGGEVTLIDRADRLLRFVDHELSDLLVETFSSAGMRVLLGVGMATVERKVGVLEVTLESGEVIKPDKVLIAAGRAGNTGHLGLEAAGVKVDARDRILVDDTFRTTAEGVYAAGDVIGPPALASVSMEQARVAACYAFRVPFKETVDPLPPIGVYSVPELAMAGLTEEAARARGIDYEVGRGLFSNNTRATIAGTDQGLVKLVFRRDDRRLLGVHILGDMASELVHLGQSVLHFGGRIDHFLHATFNVPTQTEAYKYAAYNGIQRLKDLTPEYAMPHERHSTSHPSST